MLFGLVCFSFFDDPYQLLSGPGDLDWILNKQMPRQDWKCKQLTGELTMKEEWRKQDLAELADHSTGLACDKDRAEEESCNYSISSMLSSKRWGLSSQCHLLEHFCKLQEWVSTPKGTLPRHWLRVISSVGLEQKYGAWSPRVTAGKVSQPHSIHHGVWVVHFYGFLQEGNNYNYKQVCCCCC